MASSTVGHEDATGHLAPAAGDESLVIVEIDDLFRRAHNTCMRYSILFERVTDPAFPAGYYYAHVPALDLTTHGSGIEGAKTAATDLIRLWIEEKRANGETIPKEEDPFFSHIELPDAVLGA